MKRVKLSLTSTCILFALTMLLIFSLPFQAAAKCGSPDCDSKCRSKCQMKDLKKEVKDLQTKIEKLEKDSSWSQDDIEDLSKRVDKTEMHSATDKISFGVNFRTEASSLHYDNILGASPQVISGFFTPYNHANPMMGGFNGATLGQIQQLQLSVFAAHRGEAAHNFAEAGTVHVRDFSKVE